MAATDAAIQLAILLLSLAMFIAIIYFPKQALAKLRTKNRTSIQSNRHFIQGTQFLALAKSTPNKSQSLTLAKTALLHAETALSLSPRDPAPLILKALALDLLGHKASALKSLDSAFSSKSLQGRERGDALVKLAELKIAVNRRRRIDSAVEDLKEAIQLLGRDGERETPFCLLGQCYEWKGMKDEAKWAFNEALRIQPGSVAAREGLGRLGL